MNKGQGVSLDFDVGAPLRALAGRWGHRIAYVASGAENQLGSSAVLVRPDGFAAWAADDEPRLEERNRPHIAGSENDEVTHDESIDIHRAYIAECDFVGRSLSSVRQEKLWWSCRGRTGASRP
jgi:hypothetical protein